jgi:tRNA (mo5U34)-methyltransferase
MRGQQFMTLTEAQALVAQVPHWHHAFEIFPGLVTPGTYDPNFLLEKTSLPANLEGARVLDIGTSDGFFALQLAKRGAEVVAVDYRDKKEHGFYVTEILNNIKVEYHNLNVYDIDLETLGQFDIILFLGVLYHLPDMIRALHTIRQCCRGSLFVETHSENEFCPNVSAARYYRGATLANDHTNFWAPNRLCVMDMLYDTSFDVVRDEAWGQRLFVEAKAVHTDGLRMQKMELGYGLLGSSIL